MMFRLWVRGPDETRWHPYDAVYCWNYSGANAWNNLTRAMDAGFAVYLEWRRAPVGNTTPDDRSEIRDAACIVQ
jgi:hypothetical protein